MRPGLIRLRVPRAGKKRQARHAAGTLDLARSLYETTSLPYREIAARTGVSPAALTRHARRAGWVRPTRGFGEEHYSPEGRRILRRRALAERLLAQAERHMARLETDPDPSLKMLQQALRFFKAAEDLDRV